MSILQNFYLFGDGYYSKTFGDGFYFMILLSVKAAAALP